jgi:Carboxyl transferase domain
VSAYPGPLEAMQAALGFEAQGASVGNLTLGRGTLDGRPIRVALIENRFASGAVGSAEGERLAELFRGAALERSSVVLFIDSAGAKVSEGLGALGAFRALYRAGLESVLAGVPLAAVLGRNCYGGASMLAHLAPQRLFGPHTQLAMSGPALLASSAGMSALDEMFRAMADATLSPAARAKANAANFVWSPEKDVVSWLRETLAARGDATIALRFRHEALAVRFEKRPPDPRWEAVRRRDLEKIYEKCDARESQGLLVGEGTRDGREEKFVGLVGKQPLGAARAWDFAERVWQLVDQPPARLEVFLDCASHATRLDDERLVLTEYIVDMGFALACLAEKGTRVGLTVLGQAGGGVYVALAAPALRVASVHDANIQVLPGAAVAAILGEIRDSAPVFADYRAAGVSDEEIKLGFVRG